MSKAKEQKEPQAEQVSVDAVVRADFFIYDGIKYKVLKEETWDVNISNDATPFVIGYDVNKPTSCLKVKAFLIKQWL